MRHFGEVEGVPVGTVFGFRKEAAAAGIHKPHVAGISGSASEGADSIVVSGGYEDDIDHGDEIVYTGHGGNDPNTGKQVADQQWTVGNAALAKNKAEGLPVRVLRGAHAGSEYAPKSGFRYDGLYYVEDYWQEPGKSGFLVCRFRLVREDLAPAPWLGPAPLARPTANEPAKRQTTSIQRIVRNSAVASKVKQIHGHACQVCGIRLDTPGGPYAEGAHIRALGEPHNGPDTESNILCLCPNHHVLFDAGAVTINDDLTLNGHPGRLAANLKHKIDLAQVAYHRQHAAKASAQDSATASAGMRVRG